MNTTNRKTKEEILEDEAIEACLTSTRKMLVLNAMQVFADQETSLLSGNDCPCVYLDEPCSPRCTCKMGGSSFGCIYCCRYGSLEQKKEKALWLKNRLSGTPTNQIDLKTITKSHLKFYNPSK